MYVLYTLKAAFFYWRVYWRVCYNLRCVLSIVNMSHWIPSATEPGVSTLKYVPGVTVFYGGTEADRNIALFMSVTAQYKKNIYPITCFIHSSDAAEIDAELQRVYSLAEKEYTERVYSGVADQTPRPRQVVITKDNPELSEWVYRVAMNCRSANIQLLLKFPTLDDVEPSIKSTASTLFDSTLDACAPL